MSTDFTGIACICAIVAIFILFKILEFLVSYFLG
jgi:hypothetical protein